MVRESHKENSIMNYKEIVNLRSDKLSCSIESISCFLEELAKSHSDIVEKELIHQIGIFNNKHFEETSAMYVISKMESSIDERDAFEILAERGITVNTAKHKIEEAYSKARGYAMSKGYTAPAISGDYNEWDCFVVLAMCTMDFWCEGLEDSAKVDCIAYEWLADVDACTTKAWDYFFGK